MSRLPISVLLPIYNCKEPLARHLKSVSSWAESVQELIVIDSGSRDGSLEAAKEILSPFGAKFLHHPPGLYQSWNAGLAMATAPWCYFSTVEDPITLDGLQHLVEVSTRHDADITISPPEMRNHDGTEAVAHQMPSNRLAKILGKIGVTERVLSRTETIALFCGSLPDGLLGSSASNLYRTSFLSSHPFPTDFGHCGDTAWGLLISPEARVAFTTHPCARFYLQTKFSTLHPEAQLKRHRQFSELANSSLQSFAEEDSEIAVMLAWFEAHDHSTQILMDWLVREHVYQEQLEALKAKYEGGILQYLRRAFRDELARFFRR